MPAACPDLGRVRADSFATQLLASAAALQPTATDRIVLARAALTAAIECLRANPPDIGAARLFIDDALLQIRQ